MPARIVLVHDDPAFLAELERKLRQASHDVVAFNDPIAAFDALSSSKRVEVLVTGVMLGPNQPHGIALANAGRACRPLLKVIFATDPAAATYVEDEGTVFLMPVQPDQIVQAVSASLAAPPVWHNVATAPDTLPHTATPALTASADIRYSAEAAVPYFI